MSAVALLAFLSLIGIWIFWKMRRIIWFFLLFAGAILVLLALNGDLIHFVPQEWKQTYELFGKTLMVIGIVVPAYKFARKRS